MLQRGRLQFILKSGSRNLGYLAVILYDELDLEIYRVFVEYDNLESIFFLSYNWQW